MHQQVPMLVAVKWLQRFQSLGVMASLAESASVYR